MELQRIVPYSRALSEIIIKKVAIFDEIFITDYLKKNSSNYYIRLSQNIISYEEIEQENNNLKNLKVT